jgi:hypothetical protein
MTLDLLDRKGKYSNGCVHHQGSVIVDRSEGWSRALKKKNEKKNALQDASEVDEDAYDPHKNFLLSFCLLYLLSL